MTDAAATKDKIESESGSGCGLWLFNTSVLTIASALAGAVAWTTLVMPDSFHEVTCKTLTGDFTKTVQMDMGMFGPQIPLNGNPVSFTLDDGSIVTIPSAQCSSKPIAQPAPAAM
jgi:hypothetical protein